MTAVTECAYMGAANRTRRWRRDEDGGKGGEEVWEDNGHGVLLRVSWYTIDIHILLCRAQVARVVPNNLSGVRNRENLKGTKRESSRISTVNNNHVSFPQNDSTTWKKTHRDCPCFSLTKKSKESHVSTREDEVFKRRNVLRWRPVSDNETTKK